MKFNLSIIIVVALVIMQGVCSAYDVSAPEIVDFGFTPTSLNTSTSALPITFTAQLSDDLSGFDYLNLWFRSPSGRQSFSMDLSHYDLVSGSLLDGVYQRTSYLPRYSEAGEWVVDGVSFQDRVNNQASYWNQDAIDFMVSNSLPYRFVVSISVDEHPIAFVSIQQTHPSYMFFTWMTEIGSRYRLERSYSLELNDWEPASDDILAHGSTHSVTIQATPGSASEFLRVVKIAP